MDETPQHGLDITDCASEPIRVPGSIQQHGFLLVLDVDNKHVVTASENVSTFLGIPLKLVLGAEIDVLLEREVLTAIHSAAALTGPAGMVNYLGSFPIRNELYSVITHRVGGQRVLEFERQHQLVGSEMMNGVITNFVNTLSKIKTESELCQSITQQVYDLTGYDRVMLYRFDEEGHGTVLAEETNGKLPSYLGLSFPASDIPQQARDLYVLNTIRIIPDANYTPVPITGLAGQAARGMDLSLSVLRSVSPIHLQYMRNMGTFSSMSISLICEGKLWGLISGHSAEPRTVPYLVRSACDMLTRMVGTQLAAYQTESRLQKMIEFHAVQRNILTHMAAEPDYLGSLATQMEDLMRATDADGVVLWLNQKTHSAGEIPSDVPLQQLATWMEEHSAEQTFASSHFSHIAPWAESMREVASGVLAIRISATRGHFIFWFRPEIVKTVSWAGSPGKSEDPSGGLRPRTSFEAWKEIVRGQSIPWSPVDIESATDFREALFAIGLRKAEEDAELNEARFLQLTHALSVKVFTATDSGELTYANEGWRRAGLSEKGLWFHDFRLNMEDAARCEAAWKHCVETGKDFDEEVRFAEGKEDTRAGAERWNLVHAVPFHRIGAQRAGWVGTCTDLTERKEREAALRMAEKLALSSRMTSVIAHEINNPLEAITNLMYLIRAELPGQASDSVNQYISLAESELERISGITKQTLRWSRESTEQPASITAGALFEDVQRLFAGKIRNRAVHMELLAGADVCFHGVLGQLRQVVTNLVSNALDAVSVGGRISIHASQQDQETRIVVTDNGPGISDEVLKNLFQPFVSTKGDLGNGLGLYISKEIVERHGGHIELQSTPGTGTVATVTLPAVPA